MALLGFVDNPAVRRAEVFETVNGFAPSPGHGNLSDANSVGRYGNGWAKHESAMGAS